jgi:hypothetical protein
MPIRTQLLKKWEGPDPEKHVGSTPLIVMMAADVELSMCAASRIWDLK